MTPARGAEVRVAGIEGRVLRGGGGRQKNAPRRLCVGLALLSLPRFGRRRNCERVQRERGGGRPARAWHTHTPHPRHRPTPRLPASGPPGTAAEGRGPPCEAQTHKRPGHRRRPSFFSAPFSFFLSSCCHHAFHPGRPARLLPVRVPVPGAVPVHAGAEAVPGRAGALPAGGERERKRRAGAAACAL